jgi:hypothetical protein
MTERNGTVDLVTKAEAADILRVSIRTIDRYMTKQLPARFTPTGRVRFNRSDIEALLSSPSVATSPDELTPPPVSDVISSPSGTGVSSVGRAS